MVVSRIWNFNLFSKLPILHLVWASIVSIVGVFLAVFFNLGKGFEHLTSDLAFFIHDDIFTKTVLTKQSKICFLNSLFVIKASEIICSYASNTGPDLLVLLSGRIMKPKFDASY